MARTGRFGRLPTQAPDLSGQIVSMMEQWTNARDRNILDAWTNGGKFEGKKVKDKDILNHYKKRRNSYDKDDPEWDEWNNEMYQMRFRVSNERTMMNYRMGKIGPQAVASHYREWAKKMPKNSSYYRNLMQSAGQFAKAAGAGRAAASKAYDYDALMRRVNSHGKPIEAASDMFEVLNNYARSHGFIEGNETVFTANTFEAADLAGLMAGVERSGDPEWQKFKKAQKDAMPDWDGTLSWGELKRLTNKAIYAKKQQIAEYKKAPADYSSVIQGLRNDIAGLRDVKRIRIHANAMEDYVEAHNEWLEVREGSDDPDSFLGGDETYTKDLRAIRKTLLDAGMFAEAGDVLMEIKAIAGDTEATNGTNNEALWQNSGDTSGGTQTQYSDLEQLSRGQETMIAGQELLRKGLAYKVQLSPDVTEVAASLGEGKPQNWSIRPFEISPETGRPVMPNDGYMVIPRKDSSGAMYAEFIIGERIVNAEGELLGYKAPVDGFNIYKLRDPQDPLQWFFTTTNLFTPENGATLAYNSNGELVVTQDAQWNANYTDARSQLQENNPRAIIERLYGVEDGPPPPGSSAQVVAEYEEQLKKADEAAEAAEELQDIGLNEGDLPGEGLATTYTFDPTDPDYDFKVNQEMDALRQEVFSNIEDKDLQSAMVRDYMRNRWNEEVDGPLPVNLRYNASDAQYIHPDGKPTNRESNFDRAARISDAGGVDVYDGGQPEGFVPGEVPAYGDDAGATATGQQEFPASTGPIGAQAATVGAQDAQVFSPVEDILTTTGGWTEKLNNEWAIVSTDESQAWATSALAFLDTSEFDGITEAEAAAVMSIIRLDPATNELTLANAAAEWDSAIQLVDETTVRRAMLLIDSQGDLDTTMAGAALGELRSNADNRIPALDAYQRADAAQVDSFNGTPVGERDAFINQMPVTAPTTDNFVPEPSVIQNATTGGGLEETPWPASQTPFKVPETISVEQAASVKPVNLKVATFNGITAPESFGMPKVTAPAASSVPSAPPPSDPFSMPRGFATPSSTLGDEGRKGGR